MRGVLTHSVCRACAVGNIVASSMGLKINKIYPHNWTKPDGKKYMFQGDWFDRIRLGVFDRPHLCSDAVVEQIKSTGYTGDELAQIEESFESTHDDEDGFKGLMKVVDTLQEIHQCDKETTKEAKSKFVKV